MAFNWLLILPFIYLSILFLFHLVVDNIPIPVPVVKPAPAPKPAPKSKPSPKGKKQGKSQQKENDEVSTSIIGEPEEKEETDKVFEAFLTLAGEDKEVDWKELKEILDYSMKKELGNDSRVYSKKAANGLNALPSTGNTSGPVQTENEAGFLTQLLGLFCGQFCKDSPLAEIVPKPKQNTSLMATFAELASTGFSKDICRSMIAMMDTNKSGKLGFDEFKNLWGSLNNWKNAWSLHDTDNSGSFTGFELRQALQSAGYHLNNRILNVLMHRYGNKTAEIHFDDFMMCAIKVKTMIDIFKDKDRTNSDIATFSLEEWLENTLYT